MKVFHATTPKKVARYEASGVILPPVYFWTDERFARIWMKKTGRPLLLTFEAPTVSYPLPMRKSARWTPTMIYEWERVGVGVEQGKHIIISRKGA